MRKPVPQQNRYRHRKQVKLGLNIDHVATVRQARGGREPNLLTAAQEGISGGAEGITVHLREDRRHVQDADVFQLKKIISVPLNLEMSVHPEIVAIACRLKPEKVCLVPERRKELTTEGGLDAAGKIKPLTQVIHKLKEREIVVSIFIDPIKKQIEAASKIGADYIELHTGTYANAVNGTGSVTGQVYEIDTNLSQPEPVPVWVRELIRLKDGAVLAHSLKLGVNAGHGLNYENVIPVAQLPYMEELNIGHSIVARSIFVGLKEAVREMCGLIKNQSEMRNVIARRP